MLCSDELKLQLLAKSSICPGIITIIWSLITSNPSNSSSEKYDSPEEELRAINEKMKEQKELAKTQQMLKIGKSGQVTAETRSLNPTLNTGTYSEDHQNGYLDQNGVWKDSW